MPIVQKKKPAKRQLTAEDILVAGLDALGEGFALFDRSQAFVCCNRPFVALTGYPIGLCQPGEPLASFLRFDAESGAHWPEAWQADIGSSDEGTIERGGVGDRRLIARSRRLADGSLLLTFTDVTDMRRAEAALRASEQRYALVTEAATEGFYEWDIANDALFVSPQLNRMFAFDSSGLRAQQWNERVVPEDYPHYRDTLRDYFTQRTDRFQCEYRIRVGSGEVRWLKDRASAVRRPDGRAIRLLGAVSDITAEKEVQRALAASEARYAQALEAVNESIYDWNLVDDAVFFSLRVLALFGKTHDELRTPQDWRALIHPDDVAGYHAEIVAHFKGKTPRLVSEYRYRHGDGTWHWARQVGVAQRDENGRAVRLIGSTSDITAEKTLAAALKESEARYWRRSARVFTTGTSRRTKSSTRPVSAARSWCPKPSCARRRTGSIASTPTTCRPSRNACASICAAPRLASNAKCATAPATEAGAGRASTASPCATPLAGQSASSARPATSPTTSAWPRPWPRPKPA